MNERWTAEEFRHFLATRERPERLSCRAGASEVPVVEADEKGEKRHTGALLGPQTEPAPLCSFRLPVKVPSVNNLYVDVPVRVSHDSRWKALIKGSWVPAVVQRKLGDKGRAFKKAVRSHLSVLRLPQIPRDVELGIRLTFEGTWYNLPGSKTRIKKRDVANLEKALVDVLGPMLGFDDSQLFEVQLVKESAEEEAVRVEIYRL